MENILKTKSVKKAHQQLKELAKQKKGPDLKKYSGIISLKEAPIDYQKKLRNEWK